MKLKFKHIYIVSVDIEESPLEPPRIFKYIRYPVINGSGILLAGYSSVGLYEYRKMVKKL